ncbi:acid phosphatase 1-like [Silene latifolia]|uniref:acid phosphatase 1-like n=1 Tax=Silene latifolia TaxID=37657 RepID=UPI003D779F5A
MMHVKWSFDFFLILLGIVVAPHFILGGVHAYPATVHPLIPRSGSGGHPIQGLDCLSWRFAVETNNVRDWKTIPMNCENYVGHYMLGAQYKEDCSIVTTSAINYVNSLNISKGKDIWVFDIDETALSNLPYYASPNVEFGAFPFNETKFNQWQVQASAPAIQSVLDLYKRLLKLDVKVVFLTGAKEEFREFKARNMKNVGYHRWLKMILKKPEEAHIKSVEYKSKHRAKLEKKGYKIIGNIGDQWSDLLGPHPGLRTFKLPDPMYYIA